MMPSPQDSNSGEMPPYGMRNIPSGMPPGPNPMVSQTASEPLKHFPHSVSRSTSISYAFNATRYLSSRFNQWYLVKYLFDLMIEKSFFLR